MTEIYVDEEPITVVFRKDKLVLYPLPIKEIRKFQAAKDNADRFEAIIKAITASAQVGDPSVTEERVSALITTQNVQKVMAALMDSSGMKKAEGGVDAGPPAQAPLNGAVSTPASLQPPDGDGATLTH